MKSKAMKKSIIILLSASLLGCLHLSAEVQERLSPHVQQVINSIYDYTLINSRKAQQLFDSLRKSRVLEPWKANEIQGDIYFNSGNNFEAVKFFKRSLYDDALQDNDSLRMKMIRRLLMCYDYTGNVRGLTYYTHLLSTLAQKHHSRAMLAVSLFNQGKLARLAGHKRLGYAYIRQAIGKMRGSGFRGEFDECFYYYTTLVEQMQADRQNREALAVLNELQRYTSRFGGHGDYCAALDESCQRDIYAHQAVLLSRLGRQAEAKHYYALFMRHKEGLEYDYACIMPYLVENHLFHEVISLGKQRIANIMKIDGGNSFDLCYVYQTMGDAYARLGNYKQATEAFRKLNALRQRLLHAGQQSAMDELSVNYEQRQADLQQARQQSRMRMGAAAIILLVVLLSGSVLVWRERRNARVIMGKNRWMARHIEELEKQQSQALQEHVQVPQEPLPASAPGHEAPAERPDTDSILYARLYNKIVNNRLYLDPALTRDMLLEELGIPKNKFSQLFRVYGKTSFSSFISDLRLQYACKLLRQYPNYTIEVIARECGMPTESNFYTRFSEKYGMTPAAYRKAAISLQNDKSEQQKCLF